MNEQSTLALNAVTAASALKMSRPAVWQTFAHAQQEAAKASSLLIAPSDLLCGILLNTQAIHAHHALQQLGVERRDDTIATIRANRTLPTSMNDILRSNLYAKYRGILSSAVSETENALVQRLKTLQTETLPEIEQLAKEAAKYLGSPSLDDDAASEIRELRESVTTEITTIQSILQKSCSAINERAFSYAQPAKLLASWQWAMNKGLPPEIKPKDLDHVFSKESQHILCLVKEVACDGWIENAHLLYALAGNLNGPGQRALESLSADPVMLRMLLRDTMSEE